MTRYDTTSFDFTTPVAVERASQATRFGATPHVLVPDLNLAFQTAAFAEVGVRWTPRR